MLHDRPFDQCGVLPIVDPAAPRKGQGINELTENVDLPRQPNCRPVPAMTSGTPATKEQSTRSYIERRPADT